MGKIIAITSGKGGVGKTTLTAALGTKLASEGHKVLITDGDLGLRDLDLILGVENEILFDVVDVWKERCYREDAIIKLTESLDFLPASQVYRWEDLGRKGYHKLIEKLSKRYDYTLIDAPAGIGRGIETILDLAEQVLVVTTPYWIAMRNADRVMRICSDNRQFNYGLVVNALPIEHNCEEVTVDEMMDVLPVETLVSILPENKDIVRLSQRGMIREIPESNAFLKMLSPIVSYIVEEEAWTEESIRNQFDKIKSVGAGDADKKSSHSSLLQRQRESRWRIRRR